MKTFFCLSLFLPVFLWSQTPTTPAVLSIKPYWETGDSRDLFVTTETFVYRNDTLISTSKGKWEGAVETLSRTNKDFTVSFVQSYSEADTNQHPFVKSLLKDMEHIEIVFMMDKKGIPVSVVNLAELKESYLDNLSDDLKPVFKGMKKAEVEQYLDSLEKNVDNAGFEKAFLDHVSLFQNLYGYDYPTTGNSSEELPGITCSRIACLQGPLDAVITRSVTEQKGTKYTAVATYTYNESQLPELMASLVPDPKESSFGKAKVTEVYTIAYDAKNGWPSRKTEETIVVYGPFKYVIKQSYRFAKTQ